MSSNLVILQIGFRIYLNYLLGFFHCFICRYILIRENILLHYFGSVIQISIRISRLASVGEEVLNWNDINTGCRRLILLSTIVEASGLLFEHWRLYFKVLMEDFLWFVEVWESIYQISCCRLLVAAHFGRLFFIDIHKLLFGIQSDLSQAWFCSFLFHKAKCRFDSLILMIFNLLIQICRLIQARYTLVATLIKTSPSICLT